MKVYVDISKQCIIKTDDEDRTVFKGDENVDHIKVYFKEMPTQWYLTLGALLPNGRTIPQRLHDGDILSENVDGTTYYYATFTLSKENGFTLMNGKTIFTLKIHYVNDSNVVIKEKTIGAIAVNVVDSTTEDENILILDGDTAEVVYNMKLAIENMQARLTNYENSFAANKITARALLSILNDFSSYKVVFGHSYKEDEDDIESRKYYLMAVVNKEEPSDIIFGIDADGKVSVITDTFISKLDSINATIQNLEITDTASIETLEASDAQISSLQVHTLDVNNTAQILNLIVSGALLGKTDITALLTAQKGIEIPKNYGLKNDETGEGLLFMPDGSMALNGTTKGLVLTLVKTISNLLCREYTFPDMNGNVLLKEQLQALESDIIPDETLKRALGSVLKKWSHLFVETIKTGVVWVGDYPAITTKDKEELQKQIDGINAGQNLADIVGTFALLSVYDTTNLKVNDKVQVLIDETKEDDSTVYKWNGTSWEFVGSYGSNSYTKAESDAMHNQINERISQHEQDINSQFDKHEEEVKEVVDSYKESTDNDIAQYKAEIKTYVDEEIMREHLDVIITASVDENDDTFYTANYSDEELINILINETPQAISLTYDNVNFVSYSFLKKNSGTDFISFSYTEVKELIRLKVDLETNAIEIVKTSNDLAIDVSTNILRLDVYAESYDETTGVYSISTTDDIGRAVINMNPRILMRIMVNSAFDAFNDSTFHIFYKTGTGTYKSGVSGIIFSNSKYDAVINTARTEMRVFNKREELETTLGDINSILDTLNGEVL